MHYFKSNDVSCIEFHLNPAITHLDFIFPVLWGGIILNKFGIIQHSFWNSQFLVTGTGRLILDMGNSVISTAP